MFSSLFLCFILSITKNIELTLSLYYCTVLYCTVLYCTVLYCTVLYCTLLYCTVLYCTVLYCTVLYCTVLYCTVLYCALGTARDTEAEHLQLVGQYPDPGSDQGTCGGSGSHVKQGWKKTRGFQIKNPILLVFFGFMGV